MTAATAASRQARSPRSSTPPPRRRRGVELSYFCVQPRLASSNALPHLTRKLRIKRVRGKACLGSHRHRRRDVRMALVAGDFQVLVVEIADRGNLALDDQPG